MSTSPSVQKSPVSIISHLSGGSLNVLAKKTADSVVNRFGNPVQQYLALTGDVGDWDANYQVATDIALAMVRHIAVALQYSQGFEVPDPATQRVPATFDGE